MRRTPTRGNQHEHKSSYEKLKGMALQRKYIERERGQSPTIAMWPCCVTTLIKNLPGGEEDAEKKEWKDAMIKEYQSIMKNEVWEIVLIP